MLLSQVVKISKSQFMAMVSSILPKMNKKIRPDVS
jgi:hypothetical protein